LKQRRKHFGPKVRALSDKIRNRAYSQMVGREELFERKRHSEPVAGWHSYSSVCAELEESNFDWNAN